MSFQKNLRSYNPKLYSVETAPSLPPLSLEQASFFLNQSLIQAKQASAKDEVPVGAVLVSLTQNEQWTLLAEAHNLKENRQDPLGHAECQVILAAAQKLNSWRLTNTILFVTLEPCLLCLGAMQQARVLKAVYGALDPKGGALSLGYAFNEDLRLNHRFRVEYLENQDSSELLSAFFKKKRSN